MTAMRLGIASLAAAALLVVAGCGATKKQAATAPTFRGATVVDPATAPDFALRDQAGRLTRMSAQRGRYTLVTFLYTHCPDVCPLLAAHLNTALRQLGPGTGVLAVSVDPKRDTALAVHRFVATHGLVPAFRYLTGTAAQLKPVWAAYHVASDPQHGTTAVAHSAYVLLVDPQGVERLVYDSNVKASDIVHDIDALKEK